MKNILKIFCQAQVMQYDQHAKKLVVQNLSNYLFYDMTSLV